jgi:hypothetical protein
VFWFVINSSCLALTIGCCWFLLLVVVGFVGGSVFYARILEFQRCVMNAQQREITSTQQPHGNSTLAPCTPAAATMAMVLNEGSIEEVDVLGLFWRMDLHLCTTEMLCGKLLSQAST